MRIEVRKYPKCGVEVKRIFWFYLRMDLDCSSTHEMLSIALNARICNPKQHEIVDLKSSGEIRWDYKSHHTENKQNL